MHRFQENTVFVTILTVQKMNLTNRTFFFLVILVCSMSELPRFKFSLKSEQFELLFESFNMLPVFDKLKLFGSYLNEVHHITISINQKTQPAFYSKFWLFCSYFAVIFICVGRYGHHGYCRHQEYSFDDWKWFLMFPDVIFDEKKHKSSKNNWKIIKITGNKQNNWKSMISSYFEQLFQHSFIISTLWNQLRSLWNHS